MQNHPNKKVLGYKRDSRWHYISYHDYWVKVEKLAHYLKKNGVQGGDRVAILSEGRPEWAIVDQAAMLIGAVVVPLHTTLSAKYVKYILNDSGSKILFVSDEKLFKKSKSAFNELPGLEKVVLFEKFEKKSEQAMLFNFEDWQKGEDKFAGELPKDEEGVATIIYTSGTTGEPKGVMLTHKNLVSNVEAALRQVPICKDDIFVSFLPLSHVLERSAGYYAPFFVGATINYAESVDKLADNIREIKPTILISVPRIFERVYEKIRNTINKEKPLKKKIFYWAMNKPEKGISHFLADRLVYKKIRQKLGGRLRFSISGGASLNEKVARFFEKIGLLVLEGYGLTETSPVISCNKLDNYKFGSVGQALDNVEIKIMPDKEIAVRGPSVTQGYYKRDDLTGEVVTGDGWFLTGDLGFMDTNGFLSIIGRKKEMITLANGKTVAPEKIEGCITISKHVAQALVVGAKKPYLTALIVPEWQHLEEYARSANINFSNHSELANNEKVADYLFSRVEAETEDLPDYEKIRKIVILEHEFSQEKGELTPTLKLRRDIICHNYKNELDKLYMN